MGILVNFPQTFGQFLETVSGYKQMLFSWDTRHLSSNMFCIFLQFFRSVLVSNSAISSSDSRERHYVFVHSWINSLAAASGNKVHQWFITLTASFPGHHILSTNLVSKQIYYRIDGILLLSSKCSQRCWLWRISPGIWANQKRGSVLNK